MYSIYKIQNIITKETYIGMTINITLRWYAHKRVSGISNPLMGRSIKTFGLNNFTFEILEDNIEKKSDAKKRENYFILTLNSLVPNGFNIMVNGGRKYFLKQIEILETDFK